MPSQHADRQQARRWLSQRVSDLVLGVDGVRHVGEVGELGGLLSGK
jgi:hypothetical protein